MVSELDHLQESLIRDMIIIGLHDKKLQERLLREINLTLDRTVEICQTIELIRYMLKLFNKELHIKMKLKTSTKLNLIKRVMQLILHSLITSRNFEIVLVKLDVYQGNTIL